MCQVSTCFRMDIMCLDFTYIYVIWGPCHLLFRNCMTLNIVKIIVTCDESPCLGTPSIKTKQDTMFLLQILKIWLEITPGSNFNLCILLQTGINAGQRSDKSLMRRTEAKKGGLGKSLSCYVFKTIRSLQLIFSVCSFYL